MPLAQKEEGSTLLVIEVGSMGQRTQKCPALALRWQLVEGALQKWGEICRKGLQMWVALGTRPSCSSCSLVDL